MGSLTMTDTSGQPSSLRDIEEAVHASGILIINIMKVPPEAAVLLGTIHRCLKEYLSLRKALEAAAARHSMEQTP